MAFPRNFPLNLPTELTALEFELLDEGRPSPSRTGGWARLCLLAIRVLGDAHEALADSPRTRALARGALTGAARHVRYEFNRLAIQGDVEPALRELVNTLRREASSRRSDDGEPLDDGEPPARRRRRA
jgi:hypothetical protein